MNAYTRNSPERKALVLMLRAHRQLFKFYDGHNFSYLYALRTSYQGYLLTRQHLIPFARHYRDYLSKLRKL